MAVFLASCAGTSPLRPFSARNSIEALDEIASRRRSLNNCDASLVIALTSPNGNIHLTCKMKVSEGKFWKLKFDGPLGVDLAVIEISGDKYILKNFQQGETVEGYTDDVFNLPGLDIDLPSLKVLSSLLLPFPNVQYPQEWTILESESLGWITIQNTNYQNSEKLSLRLDKDPLRVYEEVRRVTDQAEIRRVFSYKTAKSILPETGLITFDNVTLKITYTSVEINKRRVTSSSVMSL